MEGIKEARRLVNERELAADNMSKAESMLLDIIAKTPNPDAYGLLCEMMYLEGEIAPSSKKEAIYERGAEFGKKGIELSPDHLESNFWLSVVYGMLGEAKGIMSSFFLMEPIEKHATKAMKINEGYFYGAPLRVLGYYYHRIPGWPISKGDNKKALEYMRQALVYGPDFFLNHLYIAQIYKALGDKKKAREHLEWMVNADLTRKYAQENGRHLAVAKELLAKF